MRIRHCLLICLLFTLPANARDRHAGKPVQEDSVRTVPLYGNSYVTSGDRGSIRINAGGISNWKNRGSVISVFFSVSDAGPLDLALAGRYGDGEQCKLKITAGSKTFNVRIRNSSTDTISIGRIDVKKPGYVRVDMRGIKGKDGFGNHTSLLLSGKAASKVISVPATGGGGNWPYWGRRGPSVHMNYKAPENEKIRYFYNEVTVPEGNDVLHSYFMANGFRGGYMGMQTNTHDINQRRILFSVWSAFTTDNPKDIPEQYRIVMLRRGKGVHVGEFGNEGSGGQSYMHYPWEAGKTYAFLTEVRPDGNEKTVFTGYFRGHDGVWRLVASFMRPEPGKTHETNYTGMHSFLENFDPEMGYAERRVRFGNQWAVTTNGRWIELTEGTFTIDNTGRRGIRLDYDGGVDDGKFYLRNCGFFDDNREYGSIFTRPAAGTAPDIDFEALENIPSAE